MENKKEKQEIKKTEDKNEVKNSYNSSILYAIHILLIIAAISLTAIAFTGGSRATGFAFVLLILDGIAYFVLFEFIKDIFNKTSKILAYIVTIAAVFLYLFAGLFFACTVKF